MSSKFPVEQFKVGRVPVQKRTAANCMEALRKKRERMRKDYAEKQAAYGLSELELKTSWATKSGIYSDENMQNLTIDCNLYQESDNRHIYFLHIHKAGGTSFCAAARANYYFANFEEDCNAAYQGQCCGGDSIEAHAEFAEKTPYKFVANEWPMYDTMDSQRYRYVVQLRQSSDRYKSHYKVDKFVLQKRIPTFNQTFDEWLGLQPDNFSMRMICGERCLKRPKFQLTRDDFNYTIARLKRFDNIVFLEDYERSYSRFASEVGWEAKPAPTNTFLTKTAKQAGKMISDTNSTNIVPSSYTALDDAIYDYAKNGMAVDPGANADAVWSAKHKKSLEQYFDPGAAGRQLDCVTACCHKCSFIFLWGEYMNKLLASDPSPGKRG